MSCGTIRSVMFALTVGCVAATAAVAENFTFATVREEARALAAEAYEPPTEDRVPPWLREISYDAWRDIRFQPAEALWQREQLPFEVQFFHPGLYYDRTVDVFVVDAEGAHPIPFSPSFFDYGRNNFASRVPQDIGFAGFRLHFPLNRRDYKDELIAFLGASYFRALGKDTVYGISARGLAIDTALPSGEEFPWFRKFWLVRPSRSAQDMAVYALLDSPRATGAYRFVVYPGARTKVDVDAVVFLREEVGKIGIAPLTSMFFFGENGLERPIDYRPEVHDSDGLLMAVDNGEWIWRPVDNPGRLRVSAFATRQLRGFGVLQRDRDFDHYQDLETDAQRRPSVWIEPRGDWGAGHVELIEIPTDDETNDNIVAFWVPDATPQPGTPLEFSYRTEWYGDTTSRPPGGHVVATRHDRTGEEGDHRLVVDFAGSKLAAIADDTVLEGVVTVTPVESAEASLVEQQVQKNPHLPGWRLTLRVRSNDEGPVELRAFLRKGSDVLTETWSYVLEP